MRELAVITEALIRWVGTSVSRPGQEPYEAYLQPIRPAGTESPSPLGGETGGRWLYIGPPGRPLEPGDRLETPQGLLRAEKVKSMAVGEDICYRWAELTAAAP